MLCDTLSFSSYKHPIRFVVDKKRHLFSISLLRTEILVFTHVTFVLTTVAIRHVGAQTNSYNCAYSKGQSEIKEMVPYEVFGCGSWSDRDKGVGFHRIPSVIENKSAFEEELTTERGEKWIQAIKLISNILYLYKIIYFADPLCFIINQRTQTHCNTLLSCILSKN